MTADEVAALLQPIYSALDSQPDNISMALDPVISALEYQAQVQYGIIVGLGIVAGILLVRYLLDRF